MIRLQGPDFPKWKQKQNDNQNDIATHFRHAGQATPPLMKRLIWRVSENTVDSGMLTETTQAVE